MCFYCYLMRQFLLKGSHIQRMVKLETKHLFLTAILYNIFSLSSIKDINILQNNFHINNKYPFQETPCQAPIFVRNFAEVDGKKNTPLTVMQRYSPIKTGTLACFLLPITHDDAIFSSNHSTSAQFLATISHKTSSIRAVSDNRGYCHLLMHTAVLISIYAWSISKNTAYYSISLFLNH